MHSEPYATVNGEHYLRWRALRCAMQMSRVDASSEQIIAKAEAIRFGNLMDFLSAKEDENKE